MVKLPVTNIFIIEIDMKFYHSVKESFEAKKKTKVK